MHDAARARHGRDEEAILVVQHRAPCLARRVDEFLAPVLAHGDAARAHVREQVGAQDPVAQAQVRPGPILQAGEDDDLPVAAHRLRGGEDLDAARAHAHARNRIDGDRTGQQLGRETHGGAGGVALLPHVRDAQERHDGIQLIVVPARRVVRRDGPRAPLTGHPGRLPQGPQALLGARAAAHPQLPQARGGLEGPREQCGCAGTLAARLLGMLQGRTPRLRITDEVGGRQRDQRGLVARLLGGLGARGVQATQQTVDGERVGAHEGRRQEALGELAAHGHIRVALPRRHGHQV